MADFVELNEAAKALGVTPDELIEMRSAGEIHGYRDGGTWKFKADEIERIRAERVAGGGGEGSQTEDSSVLLNEESLGPSGESSSTVIGDNDALGSDLSLSSDLKLSSSSELNPADTGSELNLGGDMLEEASGSGIDSDVTLVPGAGSDSDVALVPDPGSDKEVAADDPISSGDLDSLEGELALSDDDDMLLSGSGTGSGSDLSLNAGDSGIDLSSPSDSGLSLEADSDINLQSATDSGLSLEDDAIDMGGSSISSLELPEDEDIALAGSTESGGVQQDEQFMLAPSDEMIDDSDTSGSQVIALEDSEAFDEEGFGAEGLEEDGLETAGLEGLGAAAAAPVLAPSHGRPGELAEAPYSIWNILGLGSAVLFLMLTGIMMTDILRNIWGWEDGRDMSSGIAEGITSAIGF